MRVLLNEIKCTYRLTGPEKPPDDGEMSQMALPSRRSTQNLSAGILRSSTLPLGYGASHNTDSLQMGEEERWQVSVAVMALMGR